MLLNEINDSIRQAVTQLLATDGWRRYEGEHTQELAQRLSTIIGQSTVQLASSGTAALEIILRAAGIKAGDEVLLSAYDYPGNFWAIERTGARPVLLDVTPACWSVDFSSLAAAYRPTCKALIASHLHGELQPMTALRTWCDGHNILLIEDTCQAIGAKHLQTSMDHPHGSAPAGSLGHACIVSFGGGKVVSSGRGGAWGTSDESLAQRARLAAGAGSGPYGLSELQAATVLAQLPWLDEINRRCRHFFALLNKHLNASNCRWRYVPEQFGDSTAFYQAGWQLPATYAVPTFDPAVVSLRDKLVNLLRKSANQESVISVDTNHRSPSPALPFGTGFPGFHRRSSRRCRLSASLENATIAADRTLVLHHSVVLEERFTAEQIANWVVAAETSLPSNHASSTN